ncbi:hypothetical protein NDU88_004879 [Pleurodeles waltl]|uniref:Uncharacterized protein n=1 Tax=Pleurodeles waltl TaxID=8319 RepID=A0AAV7QDH2_PLEWA|nr:hypothetical protein NDU88_004879 [Pleurodeles waltl]
MWPRVHSSSAVGLLKVRAPSAPQLQASRPGPPGPPDRGREANPGPRRQSSDQRVRSRRHLGYDPPEVHFYVYILLTKIMPFQ